MSAAVCMAMMQEWELGNGRVRVRFLNSASNTSGQIRGALAKWNACNENGEPSQTLGMGSRRGKFREQDPGCKLKCLCKHSLPLTAILYAVDVYRTSKQVKWAAAASGSGASALAGPARLRLAMGQILLQIERLLSTRRHLICPKGTRAALLLTRCRPRRCCQFSGTCRAPLDSTQPAVSPSASSSPSTSSTSLPLAAL